MKKSIPRRKPQRSREQRKPLVSPEKKHELTQKLLLSVQSPQQPPKGFNPLRANPKELKSFGLPPRPDKMKNPKEAANWKRLMLQPMKFVRPTLAVIERNKIPLSREAETETSSDFLSGAVIEEDNHFHSIDATWMVPKPYADYGDDDKYYSSAWIGLDGWNNSDDTLQGGTEQDVQDSNKRDSYAWFGWYPADALKITNFPISPGDTVSCSVETYTDSNQKSKGAFYIYNWNTQMKTSVTFDKPDDVTFKGDSAEWIMEDSSGDGNMAQFGAITFRGCSAGGDSTKDLSDADLIDMVYSDSDDDDSGDDTDDSDVECAAVKESNTVLVISNPVDPGDTDIITATTSTI